MGKRKKRIKVAALAILRHDDHLFVTEYTHQEDGTLFYRPLGGGVDFAETGAEAVQRELLEEIDAPLKDVQYVGTLENIFTYMDEMGHQVCLMYTAKFAETERINTDYVAIGQEGEQTFTARWMPMAHFRQGKSPLYPNGLLALLTTLDTSS